jgi:hypothetical protein
MDYSALGQPFVRNVYSTATSSLVKKLFGVAQASVKTFNGVANASCKKIMGVANV